MAKHIYAYGMECTKSIEDLEVLDYLIAICRRIKKTFSAYRVEIDAKGNKKRTEYDWDAIQHARETRTDVRAKAREDEAAEFEEYLPGRNVFTTLDET